MCDSGLKAAQRATEVIRLRKHKGAAGLLKWPAVPESPGLALLSNGLLLKAFHNINILLSQHQTHWLQSPMCWNSLFSEYTPLLLYLCELEGVWDGGKWLDLCPFSDTRYTILTDSSTRQSDDIQTLVIFTIIYWATLRTKGHTNNFCY